MIGGSGVLCFKILPILLEKCLIVGFLVHIHYPHGEVMGSEVLSVIHQDLFCPASPLKASQLLEIFFSEHSRYPHTIPVPAGYQVFIGTLH